MLYFKNNNTRAFSTGIITLRTIFIFYQGDKTTKNKRLFFIYNTTTINYLQYISFKNSTFLFEKIGKIKSNHPIIAPFHFIKSKLKT